MTLQARTQGLTVVIDDGLRGVFSLGVLEAEHAKLAVLPREFNDERDRLIGRLVATYAGKQAADIPGVAETRAMFHRLDMDPTKTRPSSEALLRRVLQGRGMPTVNPAVDVGNLASLEHQIPLGLYDKDHVRGGLKVRLGREGEGYPGLRGQRVNLFGRLLLADDDGPFGAPTADSGRTAVTASTKSLVVVLFCSAERSGASLSSALETLASGFTRFCAAHVTAVRVLQ